MLDSFSFILLTEREKMPDEKQEKLQVKRLNRILGMLLHEMKDLTDEGRDFPIRWNIMHMYSSSQVAKLLAIHRGIDPELAGIAAALHDIGIVKIKKHEGHAEAAPPYVYDFIGRYNRESGTRLSKVTEEELKAIVKAVVRHSEKELNSNDPFIEIAPENPVLWTGMKGVSAKGRKIMTRC